MNVSSSSTRVKLLQSNGTRLQCVCTTFCIILGFVQQGLAQDATLTGVWTHSRDAKEQAQRYGAIDQVTKKMNRLIQGRAREALREKTTPHSTIELIDERDRVTFSGKNHHVTFKTDGTPTRVNNERGAATIRAQRKKERLILTSQGKDGGVQTTVHSLSEDGTRLILYVSITAKMFKSPIRYKTTYHRAPKQAEK